MNRGRVPGLEKFGVPVGLALVLAGMVRYVSFENREFFDRWSAEYTVVLGVMGLAFLMSIYWAWSAPSVGRWSLAPLARRAIGVSVALWGLGYCFAAMADGSDAGRLVELNLFGSTHPVAAATDFLALVSVLGVLTFVLWRLVGPQFTDPMVALGSLVAILLLLEAGARIKAHFAPATAGFPTYSSQIWARRFVELNDAGFRDRQDSSEASSREVLVIGDSFAFGVGIEDVAGRFGEQLAVVLERESGEPWVSRNASRPDTHTLQHIEFLRERLPIEPDLVVLEYHFNDLDYLLPVTARSSLTDAPGSLVGRLHPGRLLYSNSYLFQELFVRVRGVTVARRTTALASDPYFDERVLAAHLDDLEDFVELAGSRGLPVRIVPIEISVQVSPHFVRRYDRFVGALERRGLPICSIRDAFVGHAASDLYVNRLDLHANEEANRLAATAAGRCVLAGL